MAPLVVKDKVIVGNSRRRTGRARLGGGARRLRRQRSLARVQHRSRQDVKIGADFNAVLREGPGAGPRRDDLDAGPVEDGRRHRLGLDLLRPAS